MTRWCRRPRPKGVSRSFGQKNFGLSSRALKGEERFGLVAPHCAIPRDYLSDTPLLRAMGCLVSQHGQMGAIPLPLF